MRQKVDTARFDAACSRLAGRQHGVVATRQLLELGATASMLKDRVASSRLHRVHRGVYVVGHAGLSVPGRWMAAVLAAGVGAVLSHASAAALWRMARDPRVVEVSVPSHSGRARREALVIHRSTRLTRDQTTIHLGIPVTTPRRTLLDLRPAVSEARWMSMLREAEFRRLAVGAFDERDGSRSRLETRFLRLCRDGGVAPPLVNSPVGPYDVDFLWPDRKLAVEVDGWQGHRGRAAFEQDRARDVDLELLGYTVARFTWKQVTGEPHRVAGAVRRLLADR